MSTGTPFCHATALKLNIRVQRCADHLTAVVNGVGKAREVPRKRADIPHPCLFGPEEGMKGCVAGQVRMTNHLTLVVDCTGVVSAESPSPPRLPRSVTLPSCQSKA